MVKRSWAQRREELERTTFAGQLGLDGSEVATTTVAPRATGETECAGGCATDEAEEAGRQPVLFGD